MLGLLGDILHPPFKIIFLLSCDGLTEKKLYEPSRKCSYKFHIYTTFPNNVLIPGVEPSYPFFCVVSLLLNFWLYSGCIF